MGLIERTAEEQARLDVIMSEMKANYPEWWVAISVTSQ